MACSFQITRVALLFCFTVLLVPNFGLANTACPQPLVLTNAESRLLDVLLTQPIPYISISEEGFGPRHYLASYVVDNLESTILRAIDATAGGEALRYAVEIAYAKKAVRTILAPWKESAIKGPASIGGSLIPLRKLEDVLEIKEQLRAAVLKEFAKS